MLIDTHCHLTYPELHSDVTSVIARAQAAGISRMITVGTHLEDHINALNVARDNPSVFAALGIHPHHAGEVEPGYEGFLENRLKNPRVVALGECGLDYHHRHAPKLLQRGIFIDQLELARKINIPVILHIRDAHADGLAIMKDFPELRFVVHCFTGIAAECDAWLKLGAYIGITGIATYKNAVAVQTSAKLTPLNRLLIETDAPYLSPEPVRKNKINDPANVAHTAAFLATLRSESIETLAAQTTQNAAALFGEKILKI
jgi:TatD DNase family protein